MAFVRGGGNISMQVIGLRELDAQFARIGKMPKKHLTKAARLGIAPAVQDAKANAPVGKTGILQKSIKKKMETPNKRNKGVYRLAYDAKYTGHFLKKTTGKYGGRTPHAYYPASQEYGFKSAKGKVITKNYGKMASAIARNNVKGLQIVVDSLNASIDELLR